MGPRFRARLERSSPPAFLARGDQGNQQLPGLNTGSQSFVLVLAEGMG